MNVDFVCVFDVDKLKKWKQKHKNRLEKYPAIQKKNDGVFSILVKAVL